MLYNLSEEPGTKGGLSGVLESRFANGVEIIEKNNKKKEKKS